MTNQSYLEAALDEISGRRRFDHHEVPFTQYLLPNGRKREVTMDVDKATCEAATKLIADGVHFDAEILTTGEVSLTAENDSLDEPVLATAVVKNGPGMREAVCKLVADAAKVQETK